MGQDVRDLDACHWTLMYPKKSILLNAKLCRALKHYGPDCGCDDDDDDDEESIVLYYSL